MRQRTLDSPWKLYKSAWSDYRRHWRTYVKILAVTVVPVGIITAVTTTALRSAGSLTAFYCQLAVILMNVAFIWAVFQHLKTGQMPGLAQAYYDSSAVLVRYLLVCAALIGMLLPAAFGAGIYNASIVIGGNVTPWGPEQIFMGTIAFIIALPSFYFITRYLFAPLVAIHKGLRPVASLRYGRSLSMGRFWPVAYRMVALGVLLIPVLLILLFGTVGLSLLGQGLMASALLQILATLILLPLANLYVINMYQQIDALVHPAKTPAPKPATMEAA